MANEMTFKRHELKYKLTKSQYQDLKEVMKNYMILDDFGKHSINNVYFDTNDYLLIRMSIEKPSYKEKLRVRSYGESDKNVFIELKKKYDGIVYKRRLKMERNLAYNFLKTKEIPEENDQIAKEIQYFLTHFSELKPMIALNYKREAYFGIEDNDFRLTFDTEIQMKEIESENTKYVVDDDTVLLEIKTIMGIPLWLLHFLSNNKIYKTSFSKYGTAYQNFILPKYIKKEEKGENYVA